MIQVVNYFKIANGLTDRWVKSHIHIVIFMDDWVIREIDGFTIQAVYNKLESEQV